MELNGLEALDELQMNTVCHNTANTNADGPKSTYHHCKKPGHYRDQCRLLKKQREQTEINQNFSGKKNSDAITSNPSSNANFNFNNNKNRYKVERRPKTVYPSCETCGKTNHSTVRGYYAANADNRPHRRPERLNQVQKTASPNDSNETLQAPTQKLY